MPIQYKVAAIGTWRSGSTWMYNALRLITEYEVQLDASTNWKKCHSQKIKTYRNYVFKTHGFTNHSGPLLEKSNFVFLSYRDPRDVVASMYRKFQREPSVEVAINAMKAYYDWKPHAHYLMKYERMINDRVSEINEMAKVLDIKVNAESIIEKIDGMEYTGPSTYDAKTGFHKGHITDGRHHSWDGIVPEDVINDIEDEFGDWMREEEYLTAHLD